MKLLLAFFMALAAVPAAAQDRQAGGRMAGTQSMNPDIGMVLDSAARIVSGPLKKDDDANRFRMRAAELVATQYVDSFARLDMVAAAGEDALNVEEAYATLFELPLGTRLRLGKFFLPYGLLNSYHPHDLPQTDRPLALERLLGGAEYGDEAMEASWLLPNPWDLYSELTVALANGDRIGTGAAVNNTPPSSGLWENTGRGVWGKKALVSRWANFFSLSDDSSLLVGLNYARGENAGNGTETRLGGLDFKYRYQFADARRFTLQGEQLWLRERQHFNDGAGIVLNTPISPHGGYLYAEQEVLPRRWSAGARLDWSGQRFFDPTKSAYGDISRAASALLTYTPSEFQRWRLQYRHSDLRGDGPRGSSDELILHAVFIIGFHPAHKF